MPQQLFVFIQMEFPWALGPADGRYLLRAGPDGEPERVVVIGTLGARPRADGRGWLTGGRPARRAREAASEPDPEPVTTTRATVIDPLALAAEAQARAWLAELDVEREVEGAAAVMSRVIHAHRIATADPYVHEVSPDEALVIRAGWGEGEQVADGRWLHARTLPWPTQTQRGGTRRRMGSRDRSLVLRPQERLAALLSARTAQLLCEELTLRARLDLDHARHALAALELDRALSLAVMELRGERREDLSLRVAELERLHAGVRAQAQAVLAGGPDGLDEEPLAHALDRLEAALRARTAPGLNL